MGALTGIVLFMGAGPAVAQFAAPSWLAEPPAAATMPDAPSTIVTRRLLTQPEEARKTPAGRAAVTRLRTVTGLVTADTRKLVTEGYQSTLPASAVTQILVKFRNASRGFLGSGFLIAPDMVVTAAHVLHDPTFGPAEDVVVTPGCFARAIAAGFDPVASQRVDATRLRVHERWTAGFDVSNDYGVIMLPDARRFVGCGQIVPYAADDRFLASHSSRATTRFIVSGFPIDKDQGKRQWTATGPLRSFARGFIDHMIDTERGESGSPLVDIATDTRTGRQIAIAIGVHSRGAPAGTHNIAARIDAAFLARVQRWRQEMTRSVSAVR